MTLLNKVFLEWQRNTKNLDSMRFQDYREFLKMTIS